ncbi:MAG: hypothetical protein E7031_10400 [Akkermansiaceae bacterium]|nr:hypothetical protein [Akkermansiaceae bacterium]
MNAIAKVAAFALFCVMGNSCIVASALADAGGSAAGKTMDPAIAAEAQKENCWYSYNEEKAPGFCLTTKKTLKWKDPNVNVGWWKGISIYDPNHVVMEARGHTFILYAGYEWDGNSVGHTEFAHLMPSLRHDALYHALKEGAPLDRAEIDAAYKADCEMYGATIDSLSYGALRLFGGTFNDAGMKGTLIIEKTTPPPAKPQKKRRKK